jgi:hypothetical protein
MKLQIIEKITSPSVLSANLVVDSTLTRILDDLYDFDMFDNIPANQQFQKTDSTGGTGWRKRKTQTSGRHTNTPLLQQGTEVGVESQYLS